VCEIKYFHGSEDYDYDYDYSHKECDAMWTGTNIRVELATSLFTDNTEWKQEAGLKC